MNERVGGILYGAINGEQVKMKGEWTYNLGRNKRESVMGADKRHGFKEEPQVGFVEGAITDSKNLDLAKLLDITDASFTLELANGKTIIIRNACQTGEGNVTTSEGEIEVRFEGDAEEVAAQ